jgi:hypothetical protein
MSKPPAPSPEQLLALLAVVIKEAPQFEYEAKLTDQEIRWLGRADALLDASGSLPAIVSFRTARQNLGTYAHSREDLLIPLHDAYSKIELTVPMSFQGAFIPGGETWNGYAALVKIFQRDCDSILVVDPYLDATIYTELAPHISAKNSLTCLAAKRPEYHAGLLAAAAKWTGDPVSNCRRVEVRYAPAGALHDRLIIVDGSEVWLISQSLKDIAKKSPASVTLAEGELGELKVQHYENLWT